MMPYKAPSTMEYDSGDFPAILERSARRRRLGRLRRDAAPKAARRGRLRGLGIGHYLEVTAPANNEMGGIRFEADGSVTIVTGTLDYGQGHATPFAQVLVDALGVPFDRIRLLQGDSDQLIAGGGTGGSRSIMNSGGAILAASTEVIEKGKKAAAHVLEAAVADIEFNARPLRDRRHRPRHRHHGTRGEAARGNEPAGGRARDARRRPRLPRRAQRLPQRLPCRRGRGRSRNRVSPRSCATTWSTISACW